MYPPNFAEPTDKTTLPELVEPEEVEVEPVELDVVCEVLGWLELLVWVEEVVRPFIFATSLPANKASPVP